MPPGTVARAARRSGRARPAADQRIFFLWRLARRRFLRLCVAIFLRLRFFPLGTASPPLTWFILTCHGRRIATIPKEWVQAGIEALSLLTLSLSSLDALK